MVSSPTSPAFLRRGGENQDHGLTPVEFTALLSSLLDLGEAELTNLFQKIDADDDGTLTWGEYLAYLYREAVFQSRQSRVGKTYRIHEDNQPAHRTTAGGQALIRQILILPPAAVSTFHEAENSHIYAFSCSDQHVYFWHGHSVTAMGRLPVKGIAALAQSYAAAAVHGRHTHVLAAEGERERARERKDEEQGRDWRDEEKKDEMGSHAGGVLTSISGGSGSRKNTGGNNSGKKNSGANDNPDGDNPGIDAFPVSIPLNSGGSGLSDNNSGISTSSGVNFSELSTRRQAISRPTYANLGPKAHSGNHNTSHQHMTSALVMADDRPILSLRAQLLDHCRQMAVREKMPAKVQDGSTGTRWGGGVDEERLYAEALEKAKRNIWGKTSRGGRKNKEEEDAEDSDGAFGKHSGKTSRSGIGPLGKPMKSSRYSQDNRMDAGVRHGLPHSCICWHPRAKKLIIGGKDRFIYVFKPDAQLGFALCDLFLTANGAAITALAPVYSALAVGDSTGSVTLYSLDREPKSHGSSSAYVST